MISDLQPLDSQHDGPCGHGHQETRETDKKGDAGSIPAESKIIIRGTIVPQESSLGLACHIFGDRGLMQPVADVSNYLATREPQPTCAGEEALLITLPGPVQSEVRALVRACEFVRSLVAKKVSVQAACAAALQSFGKWGWHLKTFRAKCDEWSDKRDWVVLVNKAKAPASWKAVREDAGLPQAFLQLVEQRFGAFRRADGKRQAWFSLKQQWRTGRNQNGVEEVIPGYEAVWKNRDRENVPAGWTYSNLLKRVKQRARFTPAVRALLHDSTSAAMEQLPTVLGTRRNLRFLEKVTFDDVRTDWLIFNPASGYAEEMWVLVARDEASAMVLGFVMLPATVREDGKATHLGAQQMKELAGYLLQTYPLPVGYVVNWIVERGTATLAEAVRLSLGELFNNRIKVHYTSMIGGKAPNGYAEKKKGNSRGKASHESHNRLFHTQGSFISGQTGNRWDVRPAELNARCAEAREIYLRSQALPEHLREQVKYPLPTPFAARELFKQFCVDQNFRKDHKLEAFDEVLEVFADGQWVRADSLPAPLDATARCRKRMEMPVERAMRLIRSVEKWDRCSPDVIKTFLEHTARSVTLTDAGEIEIVVEGRKLTFANPQSAIGNPQVKKALGYLHPDDPQFLHVTSGDGRFFGTWYQRGRTEYLDRTALENALRYTHAARSAALATARELAAPEVASLEAMRTHNEELLAVRKDFIVTAEPPAAASAAPATPISAALTSARSEKQATKKQEQRRNDDAAIAREALRNLAT